MNEQIKEFKAIHNKWINLLAEETDNLDSVALSFSDYMLKRESILGIMKNKKKELDNI